MKPLFVVFGELVLLKPWLVLQRGTEYWRIESITRQARRERRGPDPDAQRILNTPVFWWDEDPDGKVVIRSRWDSEERIEYAEPGSAFVPY